MFSVKAVTKSGGRSTALEEAAGLTAQSFYLEESNEITRKPIKADPTSGPVQPVGLCQLSASVGYGGNWRPCSPVLCFSATDKEQVPHQTQGRKRVNFGKGACFVP